MNLYESIAPGCCDLFDKNTHDISPTHLEEWKRSEASLLHIAVCIGSPFSLQVANKLIVGKAIQVDIKDRHGQTPLFVAVSMNRLDIVEWLVSVGARVNEVDENLNTPLHMAANQGYLQVARCLVESGADVNAFNQTLHDPMEYVDANLCSLVDSSLHQAVMNNRLDVVHLLHQSGADVNAQTNFGVTPLQIASYEGFVPILKLLLEAGADISVVDTCKQTALHLAATKDRPDVVELLVQADAGVNSKDVNGCTPLHIAASCGHLDNVIALVKAGSDVWAKNHSNHHPALVATLEDRLDVCVYLLRAEVALRPPVENHPTAMHLAVSLDNLPALVRLSSETEGALDACTDSQGSTLLHLAALLGSMDIVEFLLRAGSNVLAKLDSDTLPAGLADENGHYEVCRRLLREEAVVRRSRGRGTCPLLHLAVKRDYRGTFERLIASGASVDERNSFGSTPLHQSALSGNFVALHKLCMANANVNATNDSGKTALHIAAMKGRDVFVDCLLRYGAQPDIQDVAGQTAVDLAASGRHLHVLKCLLVYLKAIYTLYKTRIIVKSGEFALYLVVKYSYLKALSIFVENNGYKLVTLRKRLLLTQGLSSTNSISILSYPIPTEPIPTDRRVLTSLYSIVETVSKSTVCLLMRAGVNVNKSWDSRERAALNSAVEEKHQVLARRFVTAPEKKSDKQKSTALHEDASNESIEIAEELIKKGEWMYVNDGTRMSLFWTARVHSLNLLLHVKLANKEVNVGLPRIENGTHVHFSIKADQFNLVRCTATDKTDLNNTTRYSESPLRLATVTGQLEVFKFLVAAKLDLIETISGTWNCLHNVAYVGKANVAKFVCCCKFTRQRICRDRHNEIKKVGVGVGGGCPTLRRCTSPRQTREPTKKDNVTRGLDEIQRDVANGYKFLLKKEFGDVEDINKPDTNGSTMLHKIARRGNAGLTKYLLRNGARADLKDKNGYTPLLLAQVSEVTNVECLLHLVDATRELDTTDEKGFTALHWAVKNKQTQVVQSLVTHKPDLIHARNEFGETPFHLAAILGDVGTLSLLKSLGGGQETDSQGWTPLHAAVLAGQLSVVEWLLAGDPGEVNRPAETGLLTPLHLAVKQNDVAMATLMIGAGAEVDCRDTQGRTPLHMAVRDDLAEMIRALVRSKARFDIVNEAGKTPLHMAAIKPDGVALRSLLMDRDAACLTQSLDEWDRKGQTAVGLTAINDLVRNLEALAGAKADVNLNNMAGETPLHVAVARQHYDIVRCLIGLKAAVNTPDRADANTPLHLAIKCVQHKSTSFSLCVVGRLLDANAAVDPVNRAGDTPLHVATCEGRDRLFDKLAAHEADVNMPDGKNKDTPLHLVMKHIPSVYCHHPERVPQYLRILDSLLTAKKIDLNRVNKNGDTPLHIAVKRGLIMVTGKLIDAGANIEMKDSFFDQSPLHLAVQFDKSANDRSQLVKMCLSHGARHDSENSKQQTPLHVAAGLGHDETVLLLVQVQKNIDHRDYKGRTALHLSALRGHYKAAEMLLVCGADPNAADNWHLRPLHYCVWIKQYLIWDMLIKVKADIYAKDVNNITPNMFRLFMEDRKLFRGKELPMGKYYKWFNT